MTENIENYISNLRDDDFFPMEIEELYEDAEVTVDIFIKIDTRFVFYVKKGTFISQMRLDRLKSNRHSQIFILRTDKSIFDMYVSDNIERILNSGDYPLDDKVKKLFTATQNVVQDIFTHPRADKTMNRTKKIVAQTVDLIFKEPSLYLNLMKLQKNDNYTFTHSVNVASFMIALGRELGIQDREKLIQIGQGGLLHDVGKAEIPKEIINKPTKLDNSEWQTMQQHPRMGVEIARKTGLIDDASLLIIGQHHENFEGSGYPQHLKGSVLSVYSNMAQIVDIYDAITTKRSYSPAETPMNAAKYLLSKKHLFNPTILSKFIDMVGVEQAYREAYEIDAGRTSFDD